MRFADGATLGPYEIRSALGAGGMGEVYRARDPRLNRDVALKVLSEAFASDPARLQRFRFEAQTLAALNHPHIAQVFGFEDTPGGHVLVMELVEGIDLAERLAQGALPMDEAVAIARQIADALEAAHELGIVHRDLKPANVKLRPDGSVKLLDFGLAKALDPHASAAASLSPTNSPTLLSPPSPTTAGLILGTAAYMSPEQARGKPVDKRADIWAFGAVLFEMLTGRRAFEGETISDVIAAVLSTQPDWNALPATVPSSIRRVLHRCLEKDHRRRLRDIGEARIALLEPEAEPVPAAPSAAPSARRRPRVAWLPWAIAALAVATAIGAWLARPVERPRPLRMLDLALPADGVSFSLSPNAQHIAFLAGGQIHVMDLARRQSRALASAPTAPRILPFWSPDSAFIGYDSGDGRLWKVAVAGGTPLMISPIPGSSSIIGASWRADGTIVFGASRANLHQVSAAGGTPTVLRVLDADKEIDFHDPVSLPDGRVLVATHLRDTGEGVEGFRLELVDGPAVQIAAAWGLFPLAYLPSGHLVASRSGANAGVWVFPYTPGQILNTERGALVAAGAQVPTVAHDGTLLYSPTAGASRIRELVWVDRSGRVTGTIGQPLRDLATPALSPDGRRLAYSARVNDNVDLWMRDLESGAESRFTFQPGVDVTPGWFPSGSRVIYTELGAGTGTRLAVRNADGSGDIQPLLPGMAPALGSDGKFVAYAVDERGDLRLRYSEVLPNGGLGPPISLFKTAPEPAVLSATLVRDGRYIAYAERRPDRSGEILMTEFPSGSGRWQVSRDGGAAPVWVRQTAELLFIGGSRFSPRQMMAVTMTAGRETTIAAPVKLFDIDPAFDLAPQSPNYSVSADGKRFVMVRTVGASSATPWVLVEGWPRPD